MSRSGYKATFVLDNEDAAHTSALLSELLWPPADVVTIFREREGVSRIELYFSSKPEEEALKRFLRQQALALDPHSVTIEELPDRDWVAFSQAGLHPVTAGRFVVHGSHDRRCIGGRRFTIEVDAAQAFGTAHHGSTRGCLSALDALARRQRCKRILDVGTGTGVLAMAAARIWPAQVIGSDIDPVATVIARQNAVHNHVAPRITTVTAAGLAHASIIRHAPYDLAIANILARPLIALAGPLSRAVKPGGFAILSGITRDQTGRVAACYAQAGFARHRLVQRDEWMTLVLRRR